MGGGEMGEGVIRRGMGLHPETRSDSCVAGDTNTSMRQKGEEHSARGGERRI